VDFRLLGSIEVREADRLVPIRRQKQRALLTLLLLNVGNVVSTDRLVDELWGDDPPRTAKGSLHNYVSQLRRVLGPEVLITREPGYLLEVDPESVDVVRFERLVEEALEDGDEARAAKLREALALWRGPALAELSFEEFAQPVIQQLEERRLAALESRIDADLALGRHDSVLGELEELAAEYPLRERFRAELILALYRSGRQAEALEGYQDTRRVLVEELGIEPSPALRQLERSILRHDPALAPTDEEERPAALLQPQALRKTATILYSEIAAAGDDGIDTEQMYRLTVRASHELRAAVEYHGGTIERLTGDELMAVFGVPLAHEDDAVRAARAAVQLRRALQPPNADGGAAAISVEPRTVVATGVVTVAGGSVRPDLTGAVIGFVRRLAETAAPGEILIDTATARRGGEALDTEAAEERAVRGQRERVAVLRLVGVVEKKAAQVEPRPPFVDRRPQLERLREAYERALDDSRSVAVSVVGEPGIGKSRLGTEFASSLRAEATILTGRCAAYGERASLLPLSEIVAQATGERPRERIAQLLQADADAELVAQRVADVVGPGGADAPTAETFWVVGRFLERLAQQRPVLVILEDLHWAERTLLDLVDYLGRSIDAAPLLILSLARPELLEQRPDWAASAIRVEQLSEPETAELVENAGRTAVSTTEQSRIIGLAEGNPLFAEQLVAYAVEEETERLETVPPSLEALLSSRLDRLEPGERAVLQRASVVGREFWQAAVLSLSPPLEVPSVGRHLLELMRKGLVDQAASRFGREDAFRFHHALIAAVAYNSIPADLRAELHEQAADWIDLQRVAQDELVGYHLEQAYRSRIEAGHLDGRARRLAADAGDRLAKAGLRAANTGDTAAASDLLARAAALLSRAEAARRDLPAELGIVIWRGGDVGAAERVLREALEAATVEHDRRAELRARLELANLRLFRTPEGGADQLVSVAAEAIPVFEELGDDRALGRSWYALAFVHGGLHCHYRESSEAAERAETHLRRAGWTVAPCLQEVAAALYYGPTAVPAAIRRCGALLEAADRSGEANVLSFLAGLEAMAGRFEKARALSSRARTIYEDLAWTIYVWTNWATVAADIELLAGKHREAELLLTESCKQLEEWGEQAHLATQAVQLGQALYAQRRYDDAMRWVELAADRAATDDAGAQFLSRALRAKVLAQLDELEEAEASGRGAVELASETDALSQRATTLLDLAEVLWLRGRAADASAAVDNALKLFDRKKNVAGRRKARSLLSELAPA
jgi:DNA-binding SARP family transcriptional activator